MTQNATQGAALVCGNMGGSYLGAGTDCADNDGDGLPDALESNGCCGPRDACHKGTSPFLADTDGDGVNDGDEITNGTDPCAGPSAAPPAPMPDPVNRDKVRYISFALPTGPVTAIRVTLSSLHHPSPPNLPQFPAPNFTAHEGEVRYVGNIADCQETQLPPTTFKCAMLQCTPVYMNFAAALAGATLHVTGAEVVPSSVYGVQQLAASCLGNEANCADVSAVLTIATQRWGDVAAPFQAHAVCIGGSNPGTACTTNAQCTGGGTCNMALMQPNIADIAAVVDKFKAAQTAIIVARADVNPAVPNHRVDISDVSSIVDGFKNLAYPFPGPSVCP